MVKLKFRNLEHSSKKIFIFKKISDENGTIRLPPYNSPIGDR